MQTAEEITKKPCEGATKEQTATAAGRNTRTHNRMEVWSEKR